ncbi:MAG: branched-chain amino acid ABC transporter permease [Clostridia bacterium]|nr:branched-chain amino acid ABC transporter permease [Oscillospiraceae bacterium]MBQ7032199.1 branched-chain amino acid ABC transporter permease [Clostridia bacterium]
MSTLIDGLSLGSIYALIALGYTMVYGIAKMLNFAHGDVIMVGAYAILTTISLSGNPWLAILASIVICTLLGITIEKLAYKPLRGASPLAVLITAIGVSYFLQSVAQLIFGAKSQPVSIANFGSIAVGETRISLAAVITLCVGAIIMAALTLFIKKTRMGRAMLAVSEDRGAAQLMGINVNQVIAVTFMIGSALAAFASTFYLMQIPSTSPTLGAMPGIKAFTAAVIGGIGSVPGAMIGGVLLGVIEKISLSIPVLAPYTTALEFSLLIVILLVKPTGILGKLKREKV